MDRSYEKLFSDENNFVFIGESGCGKSEIAINFAATLSQIGATDFFDLDQTKPIFRARDVGEELILSGVNVQFQKQHLDSPIAIGGVAESIADQSHFTILDVGGNENGARMIGRYSAILNQFTTRIYYVVNSYRPWSKNQVTIDETLSSIMRVARLKRFHVLANPNVGATTNAEDFIDGLKRLHTLLDPYVAIEGVCASEGIVEDVRKYVDIPLFPLRLYLGYEWQK